ncbi:MAG: capsular polysaccharide biosynthesis glycosyltransferase CapM [uncultured bacterium]|nr:MAG: capsular polysaccharide biosynthesis glycosyltransferase CapM [uncultured bacterium]
MKIAFIGQKGIPAKSGGVERHAEEIAVRMADQGHEVFVYVRDNYTDKNLDSYNGVRLIHLPSIPTKHLDAISHTFLASIHALFQGYDIVHYHAIGPAILSWIPKISPIKAKVVATFHCQDYYHQKWNAIARWALRMGEYVICNIPNKTIAVSKSLALFAKEKYQTEAIVIPNGADISYCQQVDAISQWNLKDKKYILSQGRLIKHKGVHYLIEAFKQLEDTSKVPNNFKLVIVGDGFHTDEYVRYLHTISKGRENIIFTGAQTGEAMEQLFSHAYLFVQPSESEGMSLSLLEAMGHGLTPLVSDIKENTDVVEDNGFSFASKSVTDLRDKLAFLLSRSDVVQETGKKARVRIQDEFSWDSIAKKTIGVYKSAILEKKQ